MIVEWDIMLLQFNKFRETDTGPIKYFNDHAIAQSGKIIPIWDLLKEFIHIFFIYELGIAGRNLRWNDNQGGVVVNLIIPEKVFIERLQGTQFS